MTYPTWTDLTPDLTVSAEQDGGVPDFTLTRDHGQWWVKWRTSAQIDGPFPTRQAATDAVTGSLNDWQRGAQERELRVLRAAARHYRSLVAHLRSGQAVTADLLGEHDAHLALIPEFTHA